jgi:hypothetical protein
MVSARKHALQLRGRMTNSPKPTHASFHTRQSMRVDLSRQAWDHNRGIERQRLLLLLTRGTGCSAAPRSATVNGQDIAEIVAGQSVGVVPNPTAATTAAAAAAVAAGGLEYTIVEPTGALGWTLGGASRSLVTGGGEALHVGLGEHDRDVVVRVQIEF